MTENRKPFYHGSAAEIKGGALKAREQFDSLQKKTVTAAFVSSDPDHALYFAIVNSALRGHVIQSAPKDGDKKIFTERLAENVRPKLYLYTAYEDENVPFTHDKGTEYYSESDIKIAECRELDLATEIERLGYAIYVLNQDVVDHIDQEITELNKTGNLSKVDLNKIRHQRMSIAIANGEYHRVDIAKTLKQQKAKKFKSGTNKIEAKYKIWLNKLRDAVSNVFD